MGNCNCNDITDEQRKVLKALAEIEKPAANKEIAATSGLDVKVVTKVIKQLKEQGCVDSPARCKYGITEQGINCL